MNEQNATFSIINLGPPRGESIDYRTLVFRIGLQAVVDADNARGIWVLLKTLIEGGARRIVVDLRALEFIDSYGIGILINAAKVLRSREGDLALAGAPEAIVRILEPINVSRFIKTFPTEQDALAYLGGL